MTKQLSECPFCGAKPVVDASMKLSEPAHFKVVCIPCGVELRHDRRDKALFHWNKRQPIIAEKDAAIKELVEGLGTLRHGIFESEKAVNDFIDSLINKYKKPQEQETAK